MPPHERNCARAGHWLLTLPPMQSWPTQALGISGVVMLILAAAVVGFLVTMSLQPVQRASAQPSEAPIPRLVVHARGSAGEPLPLGLKMEGEADGAVVVVTGLVPGMTLSTGDALHANVWQVPATDLANTWVGPPMGFVGMVDLIAELQLADATVIHRQPIQIEWVATSPPVAARVPATTPPEAIPAPQRIEQDETQLADATVIHRPPIQTEWVATSPPVAAQVLATTPEHEAIPTPQQIEQDKTAMASSENPTATIKQHGGRTHQKPVASKVTALPVKAKVPQQASNERSPAHRRQSQCDYRGCAGAYRSFQASDCTYQPYGGQRRLCEKGARPTDVRERASQVSTQTQAQQCNLNVCARFYRSFDPSDCTYQPNSGGARKTCDR